MAAGSEILQTAACKWVHSCICVHTDKYRDGATRVTEVARTTSETWLDISGATPDDWQPGNYALAIRRGAWCWQGNENDDVKYTLNICLVVVQCSSSQHFHPDIKIKVASWWVLNWWPFHCMYRKEKMWKWICPSIVWVYFCKWKLPVPSRETMNKCIQYINKLFK